MDLSVIIPVHNLEKFILPMLVSLKLQVIEDISVQLLFMCDACTDRTKEIIENFEFGDKYEDVTIGECDVRSCGLARNVGLTYAFGKYIMFLDGDDWLTDPCVFQEVVNYFRKNPNTKVFKFDYEAPGFHAKGHPAMVWQYAYTREIIGDTEFKEVQPDEDLIFNKEISQKVNHQIPMISKVFYHYNYMREGSNMQQLRVKGKIEA